MPAAKSAMPAAKTATSAAKSTGAAAKKKAGSQPWLHQQGREIQRFGSIRQFPVALAAEARSYSCERLNQVLADTQILYALYKKHHWLMRGPTFYQLHLLLDKHAAEQLELVDALAERVQTMGGIAVGDPRHVAELTRVPRPPDGAEEVPAMLSRLLEAHEMILTEAHDAADRVADMGDDGTNDLLVSEVIRTGELQAWFLAEHLVDTPLVRTEDTIKEVAKPGAGGKR
ncbi:DNA starvation/stationary phase protection protein [Dactylosporangium sp. NPDC050688]|uniref:Dps family protein n=1 Tax=Dactylosporangium sp. NPDC050688 TaxID=3157217 RepID=UPI0033D9B628